MAYSFPGTVSTGDVLAASTWNQAIRENQKFGMATFTNEAARDAALTSPEEGMVAYLSAPTVPAATGGNTFIPTGITTIYNGSAWVCTTPVSARTTNNGTTTSGSFTATLSGTPGTNPSVTLVTGTTALITVKSTVANDTSLQGGYAGVAISGASTLAASVDDCVYLAVAAAGYFMQAASVYVLSGLTAGTNTFTMQYRVGGGGTATFGARQITVQGIA
jgi:hypothetical protein